MSYDTKSRTAKCGHSYEVPATFHQGRLRLYGDCACRDTTSRARQSAAASRAALARWHGGYRERTARCGHAVDYHPGPPRAKCQRCSDVKRSCRVCSADISHLDVRSKACGVTCRQMASGQLKIGPRIQATCALPGCDAEINAWTSRVRCCGEEHGKALWRIEARAAGRLKQQPWNDRRRNNHYIRKARMRGGDGEYVRLSDVIERDGADCALCGEPVDFDLAYPDPFSKSLDHIRPLARGGFHTLLNCQLAHLVCNMSKGARVA